MLKSFFYSLPHDFRRNLFALIRSNDFKRLQAMRNQDVNSACYSFKPFDQNRCIFVHIPKAAGISVSKALFGNLGGAHTSVRKYQIVYSRNDFDRYFKFTFVRNPWDRLFSAYNFLKNGGICDADKRWADEHLTPYSNFEEFVVKGLTQSTINSSVHLTPQYDFLCLPGGQELCVDFVGFFENIQEDFQYIKSKIEGAKISFLHHENSSNKSKLNYQDFYTPKMIDIVQHTYQQDISILGYTFDNSSLQSQLERRHKLPS